MSLSLERPIPQDVVVIKEVTHDQGNDIFDLANMPKFKPGNRYDLFLQGTINVAQAGGGMTNVEDVLNVITKIDLNIENVIRTEVPFTGVEFVENLRRNGWGKGWIQPVYPQKEPPADTENEDFHIQIPLNPKDPFLGGQTGLYRGMFTEDDQVNVDIGADSLVNASATLSGTWRLIAVGVPAENIILHPKVSIKFASYSQDKDFAREGQLLRSLSTVGVTDGQEDIFTLDDVEIRPGLLDMFLWKQIQHWSMQEPISPSTPASMIGTIEGFNNFGDSANSKYSDAVYFYITPQRYGDSIIPKFSASVNFRGVTREVLEVHFERWTKPQIAALGRRLGMTIAAPMSLFDDGKKVPLRLGREALALHTGLKTKKRN